MGVELRHLHGGNFQMGKASEFGRVRFRVARFNCGGVWVPFGDSGAAAR